MPSVSEAHKHIISCSFLSNEVMSLIVDFIVLIKSASFMYV